MNKIKRLIKMQAIPSIQGLITSMLLGFILFAFTPSNDSFVRIITLSFIGLFFILGIVKIIKDKELR